MIDRNCLIQQILSLAVGDISQGVPGHGINALACRYVGEIAVLTDHPEEASQCVRLLERPSGELFLFDHRTSLDDVAKCNEKYPFWSNARTRETILAMNSPRFLRVAAGETRSVLEGDPHTFWLQETLIAIAVFGGLQEALRLADEFLSVDSDRFELKFMVACESLFQNRDEIVEQTIDAFLKPRTSPWRLGRLALAAASRRPWEIYPFSGY